MLSGPFLAQIAIAAAAVGAVLLLLLRRAGGHRRAAALLGAVLIVLGAAQLFALSTRTGARQRSLDDLHAATPIAQRESFASSTACQACHPGNYASWHDSFHRTMTQLATPAAVVGNFEDQRVVARGRTYLLERRGDEFWVEMADPDVEHERRQAGALESREAPPVVRRRVVMTTGSHHQQTYWVASRDEHRVLNLPLMWLIEDRRWAPREDVFLRPPERGRDLDCWNENCVECHSTSPELRLAETRGLIGERAAELGISCEACHGPGEAHVRANRDPLRRFREHLAGEGDPTIVNPARLSAPAASQVCGQCHGMNVFKNEGLQPGSEFLAGGDLHETRMILRRGETNVIGDERSDWPRLAAHLQRQESTYLDGRFWRDGMTRVSGREHNAMTQSACFRGGQLSCLSCHSLHEYEDRDDQLASGMGGDQACLQCHAAIGERITEHTHHAATSSGSRCYNCHMPYTTYGLLKAIRSHLIDSPSVAGSVQTGRPDACNLCHLDQTLAWTSQHLNAWYRQSPPALSEEQSTVSAALLWLLKGDAGQRALAAWHMGWEPAHVAMSTARQAAPNGVDWMVPYLGHALSDPYAAVRYIAYRSLRKMRGFESLKYDFVTGLQDGKPASAWVIRAWLGSGRRGVRNAPQLLFDEKGMFQPDKLTLLGSQRDNTAVDLRE
jgi:hypothetical protein